MKEAREETKKRNEKEKKGRRKGERQREEQKIDASANRTYPHWLTNFVETGGESDRDR